VKGFSEAQACFTFEEEKDGNSVMHAMYRKQASELGERERENEDISFTSIEEVSCA
jgi:hypothetical protein